MKFIDLFSNIFSEKKENKSSYLNNILNLQTRNILEKFFKLQYLLPLKSNKEDENHWKGEMLSAILSILTPSKEIILSETLKKFFNNNFENDFKNCISILYPKYENLINKKKYLDLKKDIYNNYLTFIDKLSKFLTVNYKINKLQKEQLVQKQKENIKNFINSIW